MDPKHGPKAGAGVETSAPCGFAAAATHVTKTNVLVGRVAQMEVDVQTIDDSQKDLPQDNKKDNVLTPNLKNRKVMCVNKWTTPSSADCMRISIGRTRADKNGVEQIKRNIITAKVVRKQDENDQPSDARMEKEPNVEKPKGGRSLIITMKPDQHEGATD